MRNRLRTALLCACAACLIATAPAAAAGTQAPTRDKPGWYKKSLRHKLRHAGARGVKVSAERLNTECPGVQSRGVSAAGCIVAPYGCTANFIFADGATRYIGTARHCTDRIGQPVTMQVDTTRLARVGTVAKMTSGQGVPGNDWALIRIDPAVAAKWGVRPAVPVVGGPNGVYAGCAVQGVKYYGHGYGVAVGPGKPEAGVATNWNDNGFGWTGFGAPGDSGSPVLTADGRAAGNFTHLIVDTGDYPGSDHAGTRITKALRTFGVRLVNANGTTTGAAATNC